MAQKRTDVTTTATAVTDAQLKALIARGVADALAKIEDTEPTKMAMTNMILELVKGTDVEGYSQHFQESALMCSRIFPEELNEIEKYVGGLPDMIHGSVMVSKPKTMQDLIEFATKLMDQKIRTLAERQAKNKRKLDNNNQAQNNLPRNKACTIPRTPVPPAWFPWFCSLTPGNHSCSALDSQIHSNVWGHFGDVEPESLRPGNIKLFLVAFDSQLKVFHPLKNDNMSEKLMGVLISASKAKDERKRYIDLVEKSVKENIKDDVKSQLPEILPKEVSDYATPIIQSTITESFENMSWLNLPLNPNQHTRQLHHSLCSKSQPKSSGKSTQAEKLVFETVYTKMPLNQGEDLGNTDDQPNVKEALKDDWFNKPERPSTPESDWNTTKSIDFRPPQTWISKIAKA
nr:hypothetical protein [Tanacetum cinerariifolium]